MALKHLGLALLIALVVVPTVLAKDIVLSLNQSDYYFNVGQPAIIPLQVDNLYGKPITGVLSYTLTQEINQAGFHYSSSNAQAKTITIENGKQTLGLDFGSSNTPSTLRVDLAFRYEEKEPREVNLGNITIHFVADNSQKHNKPMRIQSSSQRYSPLKQAQQTPLSQQQQMQQIMNQMFGGHQQQNPQQRLQNNEMAQDSSALKEQMEKQLQEQQQMKQEFQKNIAHNPKFQAMHQQLLSNGYNLSDISLNPSSNHTGFFEFNYQNKTGASVTLDGEMVNGSISKLQEFTPQDRQAMLRKLQENKAYKRLSSRLKRNGFSQQEAEFQHSGNRTQIAVKYKRGNETAQINAEFENNTVTKVELNQTTHNGNPLWLLLLLVPVAVLGYIVYKRTKYKGASEKLKESNPAPRFDYKKEAQEMLAEAKALFNKGQFKDAYGRAGQALRLYLSYRHGLMKEITNDEIVSFLVHRRLPYQAVKECFDLCSLVEFAKYKANKEDFNRITNIIKKVLS